MRKCTLTMLVILMVESTATQAEGLFGNLFQKKTKEAAFQDCKSNFESREREIIIKAAALPRGAFGSTYIPTDKVIG